MTQLNDRDNMLDTLDKARLLACDKDLKIKPDVKLIYLCHPITTGKPINSEDTRTIDNIASINKIRAIYCEQCKNVVLVSPYHHLLEIHPTTGCQESAYNSSIKLLSCCDEVHLWGEWDTSYGCILELGCAMLWGVYIRNMKDEGVKCRFMG